MDKQLLAAAAAILCSATATAQPFTCTKPDGSKSFQDYPCGTNSLKAPHVKITVEEPKKNMTIMDMKQPRIVTAPETPSRQRTSEYDSCAHVGVDQCEEYRHLSTQYVECRHRQKEWLHRQCLDLAAAAQGEHGEKYRCMKAQAQAYCLEETHYDPVRH